MLAPVARRAPAQPQRPNTTVSPCLYAIDTPPAASARQYVCLDATTTIRGWRARSYARSFAAVAPAYVPWSTPHCSIEGIAERRSALSLSTDENPVAVSGDGASLHCEPAWVRPTITVAGVSRCQSWRTFATFGCVSVGTMPSASRTLTVSPERTAAARRSHAAAGTEAGFGAE